MSSIKKSRRKPGSETPISKEAGAAEGDKEGLEAVGAFEEPSDMGGNASKKPPRGDGGGLETPPTQGGLTERQTRWGRGGQGACCKLQGERDASTRPAKGGSWGAAMNGKKRTGTGSRERVWPVEEPICCDRVEGEGSKTGH